MDNNGKPIVMKNGKVAKKEGKDMKVLQANMLTCMTKNRNGQIMGHFPVDKDIHAYIEESKLASTLGAQMYYWLLKRGFEPGNVSNMLMKCFTYKQLEQIKRSSCLRNKNYVIITRDPK